MLKAGTLQDFNDSMAAAIEKEFEDLWRTSYQSNLPAATREYRRLLFVAIAQGVIKHLREHAADAFDVTVEVEQIEPGNLIESGGATVDSGGIHIHNVSVTQSATRSDGSNNKVQSEGKGVVKILVEGLDP